MGAAAVAAAMLLTPATALAGPEDPALVKFELPSSEHYEKFEALGLSMNHEVENGDDGKSIIVQAWVTDSELAFVRAHGYENVGVVHDKDNLDRIRAEIAADVASITDAATGRWTYERLTANRSRDEDVRAYADRLRRLIRHFTFNPQGAADETLQENPQMDRDLRGSRDRPPSGAQYVLRLEHRNTA